LPHENTTSMVRNWKIFYGIKINTVKTLI
jgi:hypothetical protein